MKIFQKISTQDKIDLVRNLSLLIKSGTPIDQSFGVLAEQSNSILKKILSEGRGKIEKGSTVYSAFEGNHNFDKVFLSFIRAGEESGSLGENLEFLADWLEGKHNLEKEMSSATLYPKIIVVFALVLGTGLTVFVLPKILPIFGTLDVSLPITTRILLFVSNLITNNSLVFLIGLFVFSFVSFFLIKLDPVKTFLFRIFLRFPIAGPLIKEYQLAVIAQLISVLLKSGTTINRAVEIIVESINNVEYKRAFREMMIRVRKGINLSETAKKYPSLFPGIFINVVKIGEETGTLTSSFEYLSDFFVARVKEKTAKLPTVIEPVLLILIGFFVAFVASAIIMPIYEITKGLY